MFTAVALTIFVIESYFPPLVPISGVKMGLANVVTLLVFILYNKKDSFTTALFHYAIYIIERAIVTITKAIPNIIVHFFCIPSLVLPLFFSKKLFVDEPVIVEDNPASSLD